jgi:hypothetical protein
MRTTLHEDLETKKGASFLLPLAMQINIDTDSRLKIAAMRSVTAALPAYNSTHLEAFQFHKEYKYKAI